MILGLLGLSASWKLANGYAANHKILNFEAFFFCVLYVCAPKKMFTFSFKLERILYAKNSKIVKSKEVLFDNNPSFDKGVFLGFVIFVAINLP